MATERKCLNSFKNNYIVPKIKYSARSFPKSYGKKLSGDHSLKIKWEELVWSAITVGKPSFSSIFGHGHHSASDLIVRVHTVYANLMQHSGLIEKSSLYMSLDPSEKSAVSYFLGMMSAKVASMRLLGIPWIFHLSLIDRKLNDVRLISRSQPDMVGYDTKGNFSIIEAKGRTGKSCNKTLLSAKKQTRNLKSINSLLPNLRVAVLSFFDPDMRLIVEDPEDYVEDASDKEFDLKIAFSSYYDVLLNLVLEADDEDINGISYKFFESSVFNIKVGLLSDIVKILLINESSIGIEKFFKEFGAGKTVSEAVAVFEGYCLFPDGVAIKLGPSWNEEIMKLEPELRKNRMAFKNEFSSIL